MTPQVANQNNDVCPHKLPPHSWWQSPPTHHIAVGFYDSNKINAWYILNYSYLLSINIKGLVTVIHDLWLVIIDYPGGCPYAHVYVLQESPNKQKQLSLSVVYLAFLMWPGWDIGHMTWLLKSLASTLQKSIYIYIHTYWIPILEAKCPKRIEKSTSSRFQQLLVWHKPFDTGWSARTRYVQMPLIFEEIPADWLTKPLYDSYPSKVVAVLNIHLTPFNNLSSFCWEIPAKRAFGTWITAVFCTRARLTLDCQRDPLSSAFVSLTWMKEQIGNCKWDLPT